ncbi:hypothetical protein Syun_009055 [Stephania yunnanensis]|uniref:Uncharacterized protein n=1 Tax=Stephania yunnanensis TaxID=152371 RepID=A0AAP0PRY0_9MAGN
MMWPQLKFIFWFYLMHPKAVGCITNKSPNTVTTPLLRCTSPSSLLRHLRSSLHLASSCSSSPSTTPPPVSFLVALHLRGRRWLRFRVGTRPLARPFSSAALPSSLSCFHPIIPPNPIIANDTYASDSQPLPARYACGETPLGQHNPIAINATNASASQPLPALLSMMDSSQLFLGFLRNQE